MQNAELKNRTVIVTGGGQGIGRAISLGLAARGARVAVVDIVESAAQAVAAEINAGAGGKAALALRADVCEASECERLVAATIAHFGAVHGLINNAGRGMTAIRSDYLDRPVRFWEVEPERWQAMMDLNVRAPFLLARAVTPYLLKQNWGRIVNVTTSLDTMYRGAYTPYGPSKASLEAATVGWARDLAGTGVTCNALLPGGAVNTAFFDKNAPLQREALIQPAAMAEPVCWLMSEAAAGATGNRYIARLWDMSLPADQAAAAAGSPAAWQAMGSQSLWPGAKPVQ